MEIPAVAGMSDSDLTPGDRTIVTATYFHAERTKVGSVLFDESHVRTQNSSHPSASTGKFIFQSRQAW